MDDDDNNIIKYYYLSNPTANLRTRMQYHHLFYHFHPTRVDPLLDFYMLLLSPNNKLGALNVGQNRSVD